MCLSILYIEPFENWLLYFVSTKTHSTILLTPNLTLSFSSLLMWFHIKYSLFCSPRHYFMLKLTLFRTIDPSQFRWRSVICPLVSIIPFTSRLDDDSNEEGDLSTGTAKRSRQTVYSGHVKTGDEPSIHVGKCSACGLDTPHYSLALNAVDSFMKTVIRFGLIKIVLVYVAHVLQQYSFLNI